MSLPSPEGNASSPHSGEDAKRRRKTPPGRLTPQPLLILVRTVSFWAAIVTPFLHVPLLLTGIETPSETAAFLALLALNVVALVVGHSHNN
ncbi:MAG: hypothetical protein V5A55_08205 [Halovenus sp.]